MHHFTPKSRKKSTPSARRTRYIIGQLIDLLLEVPLHAVIDMKRELSTTKDTYSLADISKKIDRITSAKKDIEMINLSRWNDLPSETKHMLRIAAAGLEKYACSASINFGRRVAKSTIKASRGPSNHVGRMLRKYVTSGYPVAGVIEHAEKRTGINPSEHFHGVVQTSDINKTTATLKSVFARDYLEIASNKAVKLKEIYAPGGWAYYCCKELDSTENPSKAYASHRSSAKGKALYKELQRWAKHVLAIPDPIPEEAPKPDKKPDPDLEIIKAIAQSKQQKANRKKHKYY